MLRSNKIVANSLVFLLLICCFILFINQSVFASAPSFKLTLSPIFQNLVLEPGSVNQGSLEIFNQGTSSIFYSDYATPYGVTNYSYTPVFTSLPGRPNISKWFNLSISSGRLLPNQAQIINYSINVPANTPAGGYYGAIFAQSTSGPPKSQLSRINVSNRVGELFYLTVPGNSVKSGKIARWGAPLIQSNHAAANLQIEDNGSVHFLSKINLKFKSVFGNNSFTTTRQLFVLPKTIRDVQIEWSKPPSFGLYKVSGSATAHKTYKLNNKYILIVSESVRVKALIALGLVILIVLLDASFSTIIHRMAGLWRKIKK